jgi:hypothetical protein
MGAYWEGFVAQYSFIQSTTGSDVPNPLFLNNLGGNVGIGMNSSSIPSLEVKSTIIETNVDVEVDGDCSVRENFLVGTVGAYTLGHPSTLLKFHTGTSGYGMDEASVFMGTGDVPVDGYAFGMYFGSNTGTGSSFIQTGIRTFSGTPFNTANYNLILQAHWGNVGIGITTPSYQLQLSSNSAGKPTSNVWSVVSDKRIKSNIRDVGKDFCFDKVRQMSIKKFNYIQEYLEFTEEKDRDYVGIIADDLEQYMPCCINTTNVELKEDMVINNCKSVDTAELQHLVNGAVKFLIDENDELRTELQSHTAKIQALEQANQDLDIIQQTNSIKIKNLEDENAKLKIDIENIKKHLNLT